MRGDDKIKARRPRSALGRPSERSGARIIGSDLETCLKLALFTPLLQASGNFRIGQLKVRSPFRLIATLLLSSSLHQPRPT
jgi:hypothetical protein